VAQGAELPGNVKDLSRNVSELNDTLKEMADNATGGIGGWASGLGAGVV